MSILITYFAPDVDGKVDELTLANQKEKLSSFIAAVNGVDEIFKSFAITHKGAPIFLNGGYGSIEIDPEGLKDLHQLVVTAKGLIAQDIAVGVGKDLKTAAIACIYCMNQRGSQKPVVYQPGMDEEIGPSDEEIVKAEDEAPPSAEAESEDQDIMNIIAQSLEQVKAQKHIIEQLREVNPDAYEAIKGIVQALIIMSQGMVGDITDNTQEAPNEPAPTAKSELEKTNLKGVSPVSPGPVRRQAGKGPRRRLVAGSIKGGKKKTIDPVSGKTKWVTAARKRHPRFSNKGSQPPKVATPPKPKAG